LMRQVNAHIESLFEISRQVTFHADLFRQGILSLDNVGEALSFFTSQLRIQPDLTYLSLATPEGEYYAAGRAPTGEDRNLRMQWANSSTGQQIHLHWWMTATNPVVILYAAIRILTPVRRFGINTLLKISRPVGIPYI